jgi:hypothetical protein
MAEKASNVGRFDPSYMLNKLYANDEILGGSRLKDEKAKEKEDPFFKEQAEILKILRSVKSDQDKRNEIRRTVGRNHEMMSLNSNIAEGIKNCDKRVNDLNNLLRKQTKKVSIRELCQVQIWFEVLDWILIMIRIKVIPPMTSKKPGKA